MMTEISYSGYRVPPEIIQQAIWLYVRFTLSFRDVEDLLAERGLLVSYETMRRWVNHFGPKIAADLRKRRPKPHTTWHLDEVYLKIDGRLVYLWRTVDTEGEVLDVLVQTRRNKRAALKLMRKLLKKYGFVPRQARHSYARTRPAGRARAGLALPACRRANRVLRRWYGFPARAPQAFGRRAYRRWDTGRLRDHIERGGLNIAWLVAVVLDEADEMLDLGFREDLEFILKATPTGRRTLMFSATMPKGIAALAKRYQRDALRIAVAGGERGHADIEYRAIRVAPKETEHVVVNLLRFVEAQTAIVFCNTRKAVRHLHATLLERGFSAVLLSGELSQHERNQSMQALRDGRARVCVATDVAARGIDLPNLGLVVHAELPHDAEALQHRSGLTGRAGRKGVSALLLLAERTPKQLGAALVRVYRSRLPTLEDVIDPGNGPERRETRGSQSGRAKSPKAPRAGFSGDAAWFRLNIGRTKNADPKWLLPMLCRKGNITKQDIGVIRIFEYETKFEVAEPVAAQFAVNMRRPGGDNICVERLSDRSERVTSDELPKSCKPKRRAKAECNGRSRT